MALSSETLKNIQSQIGLASREDVDFIIQCIKSKQQILSRREAEQFDIGDSVYFIHNTKGRQVGKVIKINRKTIIVMVDNVRWTCSPSLLKAWKAPVFEKTG